MRKTPKIAFKLALALLLAATGLVPLEAQTGAAPGAGSSTSAGTSAVDKTQLRKLAEQFGLGPDTLHKISTNPALAARLESFPPEASDLYKNLTPAEKMKYYRDTHAITHVLFFTIDDKKALINGNVMGHDVFEGMQSRLDDDWVNGRVTDDEYVEQKNWIDALSKLTPGERAAFLTLLELDTSNGTGVAPDPKPESDSASDPPAAAVK